MIVTRLEAKNYRQHPHIDADFDGQLVGLIGENGTGKSNFLKAIRHGFIGADSGETKHKETKKLPYITWGEDDGYVKVHFTHNGKAGEIHRTFSHKKTDAYFSYDGMECEGTTNVNNAVEEILGMDKEVARQAVFVGQDDLDSILFTDPRIRKLAWQKLCGIGQVNNIHAKMGEVIKSLPPVQDYAGQIRDAEFQLADLEEELKEKTKTLLEAKAELPKENNLDKQAEDLRKMQTLQRDSLSLKADIEKYDKQLEVDEPNLTELEKVAHDSTTAKTKLENLKEQERNLEAAKEADFQIVRVKGTITSAEMNIIDLEKAIAAMPSEEDLQAAQDEVSRLQNTGSLYDTLGNALELDNNLDSCVLCGQDLSDPEEVRKHIMTSREAINKELEQKDDSQEALDRRRTYEKNLELARERLKGYQDQLWQIKTSDIKYDEAVYLDTVANIALIEQEINEADRHTEKVIKLRETVRINKESKQTATDKLTVLITEAQNLIQETGMQPMNLDQQLAEVNAEKARVQEIEVRVAALQGEVNQLNNSISTLKGTIESITVKQEAQSDLIAKREVLENVRDWFHYNKGPSIIINNLLDEITVAVNDFLSKFDSLFSVVPNYNSMSFNYYYHDPEIPIDDPYPHCSEMSGGEKVVLAVSFRLATYAMFAQRVGLLVLDEPSVYLDSKNVGKLGTLLYSIKSLAKNLGLQVFISTHETSLMNHFDKIVNFGTKTKKEPENG